jgi:uncharacterized protein (TIGR00266 family)
MVYYVKNRKEDMGMQYEIKGGAFPVVVMELEPGETVLTEAGGMSWMSDNMKMDTNMKGGLLKGLGRAMAGESVFLNTYTAEGGKGVLACASSFPGSIIAMDLGPNDAIVAQKSAFLCGSGSLSLSVHLRRSLGVSMFGGEGFVMQKISGPGTVFLEIDGSVEKYKLAPGQAYLVNNGNLAAYTPETKVTLETVKGVKNLFFGGEGLFHVRLAGPGEVYLQTLSAQGVAKSIIPFLPKSN